jgi:hypothetical protein
MGFHQYLSGIRKREDDDIFTTAINSLPLQYRKLLSMCTSWVIPKELECYMWNFMKRITMTTKLLPRVIW